MIVHPRQPPRPHRFHRPELRTIRRVIWICSWSIPLLLLLLSIFPRYCTIQFKNTLFLWCWENWGKWKKKLKLLQFLFASCCFQLVANLLITQIAVLGINLCSCVTYYAQSSGEICLGFAYFYVCCVFVYPFHHWIGYWIDLENENKTVFCCVV